LFIPDMGPAQARILVSLSDRYRLLGAVRRDWARDRAFMIYARNDVPQPPDDLRESFPHAMGTVVRLNR
jgi:hypothetical protein